VVEGLAEGEQGVTERYSRRKLLNAFVSVCLAVHYGHTRGVLHRDLKPANIMLGQFGEVYVLDWGIAKVVEGANLSGTEEPEISRPGNILGTP
jgi:serine/threonine protein kinase